MKELIMNISISPDALILIIVVIINFFIGFGNSKAMRITYIVISSIFSVIGIIGIIIIRPLLIFRLNKNLERERLEADFIIWAIEKFDSYAVISIITTCFIVILLIMLLLVFIRNKYNIVSVNISGIVNVFRVIIILIEIWYSIGTINKLFDVSSYIAILTFSEIFVLYIPLIIRRIIIFKKSDYVQNAIIE
jgi:hypothetical protein